MKENKNCDSVNEESLNGSKMIPGQTALNGACLTDKAVAVPISFFNRMVNPKGLRGLNSNLTPKGYIQTYI